MTKFLLTALACAFPLCAQWPAVPDARVPRAKDGKPNLSAPPPRLSGKPDLSGVWQAERPSESEFERVLGPDFLREQIDSDDLSKYSINVFWGLKAGEAPVRPEAIEIMTQRAGQPLPSARCLPHGLPEGLFVYEFKMIQTPDEIVVLFEDGDPPRQIYTDGRPLPRDPQPSWMGYSAAQWEDDTLAVDTTGFNENSWLDASGHPRSETMHIRERYRRADAGHMHVEVTIDDPKYYTKPFTFAAELKLIPDADILEFVCAENEKDLAHAPKP